MTKYNLLSSHLNWHPGSISKPYAQDAGTLLQSNTALICFLKLLSYLPPTYLLSKFLIANSKICAFAYTKIEYNIQLTMSNTL